MKKTSDMSAEFKERTSKIRNIESRLKDISELQKHIDTYGKTRDTYIKYKASGWNDDFYEEHRTDITLHRAAKKHFNHLGLKKFPSMQSLKLEYATLLTEKKKLYSGHHGAKNNMQKLLIARSNAERMLGIKPETQIHDVSHTLKRKNTLDL